MLPTVRTTVSVGATSRDTMVCSRITIMAASTTGSMVAFGMDPWPPRPYTVTRMLSAAASIGPLQVPTHPAGAGATCWPSATSTLPTMSASPSATMPAAPPPSSSAGWNNAIAVPCQ